MPLRGEIGRKYSRSDFGDIDLVLKRSADGGQSWGSMQILLDDGYFTIGNPCLVIDRHTGSIVFVFTQNNERLFVMSSQDDGKTFSTPQELTEAVRRVNYEWTRLGTGPGRGIQLQSGRLVVPVWYEGGRLFIPERAYRSGALYSDDHGETWKAGNIVDPTPHTLMGTSFRGLRPLLPSHSLEIRR